MVLPLKTPIIFLLSFLPFGRAYWDSYLNDVAEVVKLVDEAVEQQENVLVNL